MTKNFYDCAKNGGKVISKKLKNGRIIKLCYDKEGKSHLKKHYINKNFKKNKQTKHCPASLKSLQELVIHFNGGR